MIHRIVITPALDNNKAARHNSRGPLFDVSYNGNIIVTATTEPCLDAARALKAMCNTGKLELWDNIVPYVRLTVDIGKAASLTVREGDRQPGFAKFESFSQRLAKDGDLVAGASPALHSPKTPSLDSPSTIAGGVE